MKPKIALRIAIFTAMFIFITVLPGLCDCEKQWTSKINTTYTDPEKTIQCRAGGAFSIVLDSNPTTGYQWRLAHSSDGELLKLINSKYRASKIELEGAGGKEIWSFEALSVGQKTIVFEYVRSWEKDTEPIKRMTFTVNIQ